MNFNLSDIHIIKNSINISDFTKIHNFLQSDNLHWSLQSSKLNENSIFDIMFLKSDLKNNPLFTDTIFNKYVIPQLNKIPKYANKPWKIDRTYFNGQSFGQNGNFHRDYPDINYNNPNRVSVLIYTNHAWNPLWGGCTVFMLNETTKDCFYNQYMPNSMAIFPPNILHAGMAPTRQFKNLRTTLIYHLHLE